MISFCQKQKLQNMLKCSLAILIALFRWCVIAQDIDPVLQKLELEVIQNNQLLKLDKNALQVAINNYTKGNSGMLPYVTLNVRDNATYASQLLQTADGREIVNNFTLNNTLGASITAEMTLFNGGRNQHTYKRWGIAVNQAKTQELITKEDLILATRQLYYLAIRQKQLIKTTEAAAIFTNELLELAQSKLDIGTGNKLIVLQSEIDKNSLAIELNNQNILLQNIYDQLNTLRNKPLGTDIPILDASLSINRLDRSVYFEKFISKNSALQRADLQIALADSEQQIAASFNKPTITATLGYNFNRSDNGGGFFLVNQSNGLAGNINVLIPLYTGGVNSLNYQNAGINALNARLNKSLIMNELQMQFEQTFRNYENALITAELQAKNVKSAEENLNIGLERFRVGLTDGFEIKQLQQSYLDVNFRYIDALYQIKLQELQLMRLAGDFL